jgi:hypothetical protein
LPPQLVKLFIKAQLLKGATQRPLHKVPMLVKKNGLAKSVHIQFS